MRLLALLFTVIILLMQQFRRISCIYFKRGARNLGVNSHSTNSIILKHDLGKVNYMVKSRTTAEGYSQDDILLYPDGTINESSFRRQKLEFTKNKLFSGANKFYETLKGTRYLTRTGVYAAILSVCTKKEHLPFALAVFNEMIEMKIAPCEATYVPLIRCYSDDNQTKVALELIDQMKLFGLEPKLRTYIPVFEHMCTVNNDPIRGLELLSNMLDKNVVLTSAQLVVLINSAKSANLLGNLKFKNDLHTLISRIASELLGITNAQMQVLSSVLSSKALNEIKDQGILVENNDDLEDIRTGINDTITYNNNNNYYCSSIDQIDRVTQSMEDDISNNSSYDSEIVQDLQIVIKSTNVHNQNLTGINFDIVNDCQIIQQGRIVDISNSTCRCPLCDGKLKLIHLTPDEKERVRIALFKIAGSCSATQAKNLMIFSDWLNNANKIKPYTYIIDGANVAYNKQNFNDGGFSFRQINMMVNKIKEKYGSDPNCNILILIPDAYAKQIVPNSVLSRKMSSSKDQDVGSDKRNSNRKLSYLTDEDMQILKKFENENMLYLVPPGGNDDWYWIYATVSATNPLPSYAITNDLMRDHRLAFLEPRLFLRWRTSMVMPFDFSSAIDYNHTNPNVYIQEPSRFSREIQFTDNGRWHFPSTNSRGWLCASFN